SRNHTCTFYVFCSCHRLDVPSFPTRRSSDLARIREAERCVFARGPGEPGFGRDSIFGFLAAGNGRSAEVRRKAQVIVADTARKRSEEHTSELQSHLNLVCRLLLAKKEQHRVA